MSKLLVNDISLEDATTVNWQYVKNNIGVYKATNITDSRNVISFGDNVVFIVDKGSLYKAGASWTDVNFEKLGYDIIVSLEKSE
jgi:hypothetical protein